MGPEAFLFYEGVNGTENIQNISTVIVKIMLKYVIAIIYAVILNKQDIKEFTSAMKLAFTKLEKQLHTISVDDVMYIMGFNKNWTKLASLKN